ncbi:MAG TPA: hypothetical protein VLF93_07135 [Candidatus Saccharimonadales bacterium]|nr:hypothetical protein [Candidatus Saccharimonadales bacterium]
MSAIEQRNGKIIPARWDASRATLAEGKKGGSGRRQESLWDSQPNDLFMTVFNGYYPGSPVDVFPINSGSHAMFLQLYDGYDKETQRRLGTREEYKNLLDDRLDNPEPQLRHALWGEGIEVFSRALALTGEYESLPIPCLSGNTLDAYDKVLVDPRTTQEEDQERVLFRLLLDDIEEKSLQRAEGPLKFSPFARLPSLEMARQIRSAVWDRASHAKEIEPDFTNAVDLERRFDNPTQRQFFLAGGIVVHDLFDLNYQIEALKKQTGF